MRLGKNNARYAPALGIAMALALGTLVAAPSWADDSDESGTAIEQSTDQTSEPSADGVDDDATDDEQTEASEDEAAEGAGGSEKAEESQEAPRPSPSRAAASPLAAARSIQCAAGYVYSMGGTGQLYEVSPSGTVTAVGTSANNVSSFNGLGIGQSGAPIYAYERTNSEHTVTMYQYNATSGAWTNTGDSYDTSLTSNGAYGSGSLVAGAVNLNTGKYLFGGYETNDNGRGANPRYTQVFKLWQYNPGSAPRFTYKGYINTYSGDDKPGSANGDLAFDAAGALFAVRGSGSTTTVFSVTAANLASAGGGRITASGSSDYTTTSNVNGVAFDADGKAYLGAASALESFTMPSWSNKARVTDALKSSTDLASCSSPVTVTLEKVVTSRYADTDQFALKLAEGSTELGTATTEGARTGVQEQRVGPQPTARGKTFTFSETGTGGADLANYTSSYVCTVDGRAMSPAVQGAGTRGSVTIPSTGEAVVCRITNQAKTKPRLTLVKEAKNPKTGTGYASAGDWTLIATGSGAASDSKISGATGTARVTDAAVSPGTYSLTESANTATGTAYNWTGLKCVDADGDDIGFSASTTGGVVISGALTLEYGDDVTCTYTNTAKTGSAGWKKTDADGKALGGSEWTLKGPGVPSGAVVVDCTAAPCGSGAYSDQNPAAGVFALTDLSWGDYTLTESKSPSGYVRDDTVRTFSITASKLNYTFDEPFVNTPREAPALPLTGGQSAAIFTLLGVGLFGVALAIVGLRRRALRRAA